MKKVFIVTVLTSFLFTSCLCLLNWDNDDGITHYSPNGDSITAYPDGTTRINEGEHQRTVK